MVPLREKIQRRGHRQPVQHILGETVFCGHRILCSPQALIPRPETELLVELVADYCKAHPPGLIYDIGTGSGALAIALAHLLPDHRFIALDSSDDALDLAKKNDALYPHLPIEWRKGDLLLGCEEKAVAVVSNLPYLTDYEMDKLSPEVKADPSTALHGGKDGLDLIRKLLPQAAQLTDFLALEIGIQQGKEIQRHAQEVGFINTLIENDLTGRERYALCSKTPLASP
jgi:release factor glutamine methyltransferase